MNDTFHLFWFPWFSVEAEASKNAICKCKLVQALMMFIQFFHLLGNIDTFCVSELMEDGINENQEVLRSLEEEVAIQSFRNDK